MKITSFFRERKQASKQEPWGGADEDELREKFRAADGGEDADHGREGMTNKGAAVDTESIEDGEEIVDEGVEGGVAIEVEVVGVDAAGTDEVVENDFVVAGEKGEDALPCGLVGAESMGKDEEAVAIANDPNVEDLEKLDGAAIGAGGGVGMAPHHCNQGV